MKRQILTKQILLALCLGSAVILASGCAANHTSSLDGGTTGDYPYSTVEGDTITYHFSNLLGIEDHVKVERDGEANAVQATWQNVTIDVQNSYTPELRAISEKSNAFGVWVKDGWQFSVNRGVKVRAVAKRQSAYGVDVSNHGDAYFDGKNTSIEAQGEENAYAIIAERDGFVQFGADNASLMATAGRDAYGLSAEASEILFKGNNTRVQAVSTGANGTAKGVFATRGGKVTFAGTSTVQTSANGSAYGVDADQRANVSFRGATSILAASNGDGEAYGVRALNNASVNFYNDATITALKNGQAGWGVWSLGGNVAFAGNAAIQGNVYAAGQGGKISFAQKAALTGDLKAEDGGQIDLKEAAHSVRGNLLADRNGRIDLALSNGGSFYGSAFSSSNGKVNLTLRDGAVWQNTGRSVLTNLTANKGVIDQNSAEDIFVGNFSGSAQVNYKSENDQIWGGKMIIDRAQLGSQLTMNTNSWGDKATIADGLKQLAQKLQYNAASSSDPAQADGNLTAKATIHEGLTTAGATADITLVPKNAAGNTIGTVYAAKTGRMAVSAAAMVPDADFLASGAPEAASEVAAYDFRIENISYGREETATMRGVKGAAAVNLLGWRSEISTMSPRLGELRSARESSGLWAKLYGGETEYARDTYFKNKYQTYQIGYDKRIAAADGDSWFVGGALSYTDGSSAYESGGGENSSAGLSLYGGWQGGKGHFFDLIVRESRLNSEYTIYGDGLGLRTGGEYDNWGTSISAEYGRRLPMNGGWYFEPQVALTYGHVGGASYTTDNAMRVEQDGMDSLVGRVGFAVGKTLADGGSVYLRAAALHEFAGETSIRFSPEGEAAKSVGQDFGGSWGEIGIGGNFALSDHSYAYADVEKSIGGDVKTPWRYNAGVRVSF